MDRAARAAATGRSSRLAAALLRGQPGAARDDRAPTWTGCATSSSRATRRADEAGFDLLELHMAHGYLLLVPLAAHQPAHRRVRRRRCEPHALPARGLRRVRAAWPDEQADVACASRRPTGSPAASTADDAVALARMLKAHGVRHHRRVDRAGPRRRAAGLRAHVPDAVRRPDPPRGRDPDDRRRRHLAATITSTRSSLAGRADLCALGRPHLDDPYLTLHAAAEQGYGDTEWIVQYQAGSRRPMDGRLDGTKPPPRSFDLDGPELLSRRAAK